MKIIYRQKDTGKTKELIKYSLDTNIPIFAIDFSKANSLSEKSQAYFHQFVNVLTPLNISDYSGPILIDDADEVLDYLLNNAILFNNVSVAGIVLNAE